MDTQSLPLCGTYEQLYWLAEAHQTLCILLPLLHIVELPVASIHMQASAMHRPAFHLVHKGPPAQTQHKHHQARLSMTI